MCPVELDSHAMLKSDRYHASEGQADDVEQIQHKRDPMDTDEMSYIAEDAHDGEWEYVYAAGDSKGRGEGPGKYFDGGGHRMVQISRFGTDDGVISVESDPDWAECSRAGKSKCGRVFCIGSCLIKHWSSTHQSGGLVVGRG